MSIRDSYPEDIDNPLLMEDEEVPVEEEVLPAEDMPVEEVQDIPVEEAQLPTEEAQLPTEEVQPQSQIQPITKEDIQSILQETLAQQQQPIEEQEIDPETAKEQFMDKFYENPQQAIEEIIKPYKEKIEEQEKSQQWQDKAMQFLKSHPDAEQSIESIVEILQSRPEIQNADDAYEVAYKLFKADAPPTADAVMQNQDVMSAIKGKMIQDPDVKKAIIDEYIKGLNNQEKTPDVIGSQVGQTPITEGKKPRTIAEATKMAFR